jgi:alginate O-acetyltransferase complex protein AlgI
MKAMIATILLVLFVQVYWLVPKHWQNPLLILAATSFGLAVAPVSFALAIGMVVFSYWALKRENPIPLIVVVAICLLPMVVIKLAAKFSIDQMEQSGIVGLSYFTFVLIGAYLDLRKQPSHHLLKPINYFAFISFFPLLPVGPIERVGNLGVQITTPRTWQKAYFIDGLMLIAIGIFKKVVIADRLSELVVDVNRNSLSYHGLEMWAFAFLSLLQVFADFSSIVDIVRGISRLLGFDVMDNFDRPYLATSVQDIWRRWHISLVSWLRDFVYTPIALRTRSVIIASGAVMLAIGMWHEISWRFLLWTIYWTFIFWLAVMLRNKGVRIKVPRLFKMFLMISLMAFSTLFISPNSMGELKILAINFFSFSGAGSESLRISPGNLSIAISGFATVVVFDWFSDRLGVRFPASTSRQTVRNRTALSLTLSACLLIISIALAAGSWEKFIYLRY